MILPHLVVLQLKFFYSANCEGLFGTVYPPNFSQSSLYPVSVRVLYKGEVTKCH